MLPPRIITALRRYRSINHTRRALHALSDHQLADIGLTRDSIDSVAAGLADRAASRSTGPAATSRGMRLAPLFEAYLPRRTA